MIDWIKNAATTPWIALVLYWIPLVTCAIGYLMRTHANYQIDTKKRAEGEARAANGENNLYNPTDTVGSLIGRAIVTIMPVGNLLAAIFDVSPKLFAGFFGWLERVFNQPLVPKREKEHGIR